MWRDKRAYFKTKGIEHSVASPIESAMLIDRMISPLNNNVVSDPNNVFAAKLSPEQLKSSCVITHYKCTMAAASIASINNFTFVISISIIFGGEVDLNASRVEITGALLNKIVNDASTSNK